MDVEALVSRFTDQVMSTRKTWPVHLTPKIPGLSQDEWLTFQRDFIAVIVECVVAAVAREMETKYMTTEQALRLLDILANWMASSVPISERQDLAVALTALRTQVASQQTGPVGTGEALARLRAFGNAAKAADQVWIANGRRGASEEAARLVNAAIKRRADTLAALTDADLGREPQ